MMKATSILHNARRYGRKIFYGPAAFALLLAVDAEAAALCVKTTLTGALTLREVCRSDEMQIGSFDGSVLQWIGINVQIVDGSGNTGGPPNGRGNLIIGYNEDSDPPNDR